MRVAVVGAGLGGLSSACHLVGAGHDVVVFERNDHPGGRAGLIERDGFRFDTGPTVLTMTDLLDEAFTAAGTSSTEMLKLNKLDPAYRAQFPDGSEILCRHGIDAMATEIATKCSPKDAVAFSQFCKWLEEMYELEKDNFIDRNFDGVLGLAWPPKPMVDLLRLGGLRKLSSVVDSYFNDERLQRIFSFQAMYAGLSPFDALAIYSVITYMDMVRGVYFPEGGMHAVPRALATAVENAGGEIRYNAPVEKVTTNAQGASGLLLADGTTEQFDAVVVNADLPVAYRELLPDHKAPSSTAKGKYSPSCLVWLAGVKGDLPKSAHHHNIHFGGQWKEAFEALMKDGRPMPDPSILVTIPTMTDPSLAPEGHHILYVLEPCPNLDGAMDWERELPVRKQRLVDHVASLGYPTDVVAEELIGPMQWQEQGMERGTPFAMSHHFFQTGPFRPKNFNKDIPGLYFTGSGTTPGVGVPMVLLSGKHAAQRVEEQAR